MEWERDFEHCSCGSPQKDSNSVSQMIHTITISRVAWGMLEVQEQLNKAPNKYSISELEVGFANNCMETQPTQHGTVPRAHFG